MLKTTHISYHDGATELEGYLAYTDSSSAKRPAVLIGHDWSGRNEFTCDKAKALAQLGYVGFALDMYGKGKLGTTKEEKSQLIQPFLEDRAYLLQRITAALKTIAQQPQVDATRIAAIGFCFGGLCILDLARSGAAVKGVISFHGSLHAPKGSPANKITAKILALHGHDDPMVPPEQVLAFQTEMTHVGADWQMQIYGHTMHAFTNPLANDPSFGTVFEAKADKRSWQALKNFLAEIFG